MELVLTRRILTHESTEGDLTVNGEFKCFTLELPVKDGLPGSAIPQGTYTIVLALSPKFKRSEDIWVKRFADSIPHLCGIPSRSSILIHWGNSAVDTEGCILVGLSRGENFIGSSRAAFAELHPLLLAAQMAGDEITIQVCGADHIVGASNHDEVQSTVAGE